jgi:hypothetical protein
LRDRQSGFNALERIHDLAIGESRLLHVEPPQCRKFYF